MTSQIRLLNQFLKSSYNIKLGIHQVSRRDMLSLALIVIVGSVVRFSYPQIIDWSKDHSEIAMIALDMVAGKGIPLAGQPSSAAIPHSPFYVYILAIPYAITDNPIVVTGFITFLNLLGVVILWYFALRYFGSTTALVAGLAYAVNPWAVGYGRSIWSGDHRASLLLLGILVGVHGFAEGKRWAQILCLPIILIALQIHFAALVLLPVILCLFWMGQEKTSWRVLAVSATLGLLVLLPFVVGVLQVIGSDAFYSKGGFQPQSRELTLRDIAKPAGYMVWLATGLGVEQYSARENIADVKEQVKVPQFLWILQAVAVVIGFIGLWRYYNVSMSLLVSTWAFLPMLVFSVPIIGVFPHYFIPVIPALCLLAGVGVQTSLYWLGKYRSAMQLFVFGVFGIIFTTQATFYLGLIRYVDTHFTPSQFGFGTPVHYIMAIRPEMQKHQDLVFITSGDWLEFSRTGSRVWAPFVRGTAVCLRDVVAGSNIAVLPAHPFAAVFAPRVPSDLVLEQLYQNEAFVSFDLRLGEGSYRIYSHENALSWSSKMTPITVSAFENGVQITGYRLDSDQLTLQWLLPASTEIDYTYSVDILDAAGNVLHQQQGPFWPSANWCQGDRLLSWLPISRYVYRDVQSLRINMTRVGELQPDHNSSTDNMNPNTVTIKVR